MQVQKTIKFKVGELRKRKQELQKEWKRKNRKHINKYDREYYHKKRKELLGFFGNKCQICGSKKNLEFHHYHSSLKEHGESWLKSSKNRNNNDLTLLCKHCHVAVTKMRRLYELGKLDKAIDCMNKQTFNSLSFQDSAPINNAIGFSFCEPKAMIERRAKKSITNGGCFSSQA